MMTLILIAFLLALLGMLSFIIGTIRMVNTGHNRKVYGWLGAFFTSASIWCFILVIIKATFN